MARTIGRGIPIGQGRLQSAAAFKSGSGCALAISTRPATPGCPRYARGKTGQIDRDHGVYVFPDTNARYHGEKPQHVYSVRFAARELWGPEASPRDSVYIDMWDDYLERA